MSKSPPTGATIIALPKKIGGCSAGPLRILAYVPWEELRLRLCRVFAGQQGMTALQRYHFTLAMAASSSARGLQPGGHSLAIIFACSTAFSSLPVWI